MKNEMAYYGGQASINVGDYKVWPCPCKKDLHALERVVAGEKYHRVNNPIVMELEKNMKQWSSFKGCRIVNTGTSAIHIGMDYFSEKHESVIVSALNWPSAVAPIYMAGMKPVYVDVDLNDSCASEKAMLDLLDAGESKFVYATHLFGNVAYIPQIRELASMHEINVFDDCSQGMGISRLLASSEKEFYTDGIAFSGNGAKHLASGELGVLLTNDMKLIEYVDYLSLSSSSRNGERIFSPFTKGYNYRPNVFSAAVAMSRLEDMDEQLKARRRNVIRLYNCVKDLVGLVPVFNFRDENINYYGAPFRIALGELGLPIRPEYRDYIVELMRAEGVPVDVWLRKFVWEYLDYERTNCCAADFPNSKLLLDTMFYVNEIAGPNTEKTMELYAKTIQKVWCFVQNNVDFVIEEVSRKINTK